MKKIIIIVLCLAGIAGAVVYRQHWMGRPSQEEQITRYTCPMHPQIIRDKPGACPICGMTLQPISVPSAGVSHPSSFLLTPERRQMIGITTALVEKKLLREEKRLPGKVAYDQELYATEKEYAEGLKMGASSELLNTVETKMKRLGISKEELQNLRANKKSDEGLVTTPHWVYAAVYESDLGWMVPGLEATLSLPQDHTTQWRGVVRQITPVLDSETRTATARIFVDVASKLSPETYVDVVLQKEVGENLAIPANAVIDTGVRQFVFVDLGEGYFEPRPVTVGPKAGVEVPVISGLQAGESVITSAQFLIDSESQIQSAIQQFGKPTEGH